LRRLRREARAASRLAGIALLAAAWLVVLSAPGASAVVSGPCDFTLAGRSVAALPASDPGNPIQLTIETPVRVGWRMRAADPITIVVDTGTFPVATYALSPRTARGTDAIDLRTLDGVAAGLYHVTATTNRCEADTWVRVVTPSPLTTAAGLAGLGLLVVGLLLAISGILAGARVRGGRLRAILGGAVAGAGALVVSQQLGVVPLQPHWIAAWTILPGAVGGLGHFAVSQATGAARVPGRTAPRVDDERGYRPDTRTGGLEETTIAAPSGVGGATAGVGAEPPPPIDMPTAGSALPPAAQPPAALPPAAPPAAALPPTAAPAAGAAAPAAAGPVGAGPIVVADPPRTTYARIECSDAVLAGREFPLVVGLTGAADPRVVGGPMERPADSIGPYTMTIQVVADGFSLSRADGSWRVDLPVTAVDPYPTAVIYLIPDAQQDPIRARSVSAMFSVEGHPIGLAVRPVAVVRDAVLLGATPSLSLEPAVGLSLPSAETAPDLTVRIEYADGESSGRLLWQLLTPHQDVALPDAPLIVDIGSRPQAFLQQVVRELSEAEGQPGIYEALRGVGLTVADQIPTAFWDALAAVAERAPDRVPAVLMLSAEPYVPWELAVLDEPLHADAPPFLSAQVNVGRWVLGQRRPKLPPPAGLEVGSMAVVSGVYGNDPQWARLEEAEAEAAELAKRYDAASVTASAQAVLSAIKGSPKADLLHFAVHGQYDPQGDRDGVILVDGMTLDPLRVRGAALSGQPFVFLNACQVGNGSELLGDYAGMAEAFLFAGASGVVAPLWDIDDIIAKEIALRFYERSFAGVPPAGVLRAERQAFRDSPDTISSTYLAYQFYGHPSMKLTRAAH